MNPAITIGGVDMTHGWDALGSTIASVLTSRIDTASLVFRKVSDAGGGGVPIVVEEGDEVVIYEGSTRYFGGYIVKVDISIEGITRVYKCAAQDYTILLDSTIINEVYENMTDQAILLSALEEYLPEIGKAYLNFDGVNDYVDCGNDGSLEITDEITLETWINIRVKDPLNWRGVLAKGGDWGAKGYHLVQITDNSIRFSIINAVGVSKNLHSDPLTDGELTHVVGTFDGSTMRMYVDGVEEGTPISQTDIGVDSGRDLKVGKTEAGSTFDGPIYTARVWGRALSATEVLAAFHKLPVDDTDLVLDIPMNEGSGSTTYDSSDEGNDGTIIGATWTIPDIEVKNTLDRLVCNRWTLRYLVDYLAKLAGYDWYVDYNKGLHFFARETNAAPFDLSDNPDGAATYPFSMRRYRKDGTKIINRVYVRGGSYLSSDTPFELPANNQTTEIWLPYEMFPPDGETDILVWQNDGSDGTPSWTAKTVGIDGIDSGKDVYHNRSEKLLRWTTAPPDLLRAIKVTGQYQAPVLARSRSADSYAKYGRWYDGQVVDSDIDSKAVARLRGKAVLAQHALAKEQGTAILTKDGLTSGMYISIRDDLRGIDGKYLIHKVVTRFLGNEVASYSIDFGEYNPDLVDLLLELKAGSTQYLETKPDEKVNDLMDIAESMTMTDGTPAFTATGPNYYCATAVSGDEIKAGFWVCAA